MEVKIVKFDNMGRGIGYINDKIIFIPKTAPLDIVDAEIVLEKKDYYEGKLKSIIKPSRIRRDILCPYFDTCGGCDLMHISISESLEYKLEKVNDLLKRNNIDYKVSNIIKSINNINYRNKITLKIVDGKIGYYESNTHKLIEIDNCLLCNNQINEFLKDIKLLDINNGDIVIRSNYKNELLIVINSDEDIKYDEDLIDNYLIAGIIINDKLVYGDDYFIDKINDYLFKVSYDSFFQVNPFICSKLFELVSDYTKNSNSVLDLYCGVGTLGIVAAKNAKKVTGVEIVKDAIKDANTNKLLNKTNNIEFICNDTKKVLDIISNEYETIILDPPRSGIDTKLINKIIDTKISNIIYISCNEQTLARDLKLLNDFYKIDDIKLLDMFPNTEHCESICLLERK